MSDHLPDCTEGVAGRALSDYCICDRLRAAVARAQVEWLADADLAAYLLGRRAALDAARSAVRALPFITDKRWEKYAPITPVEYRRHVLAIIDGEEKWGDQTSTSRPTPTGQRDVGPSVSPAGEELRGTNDALRENA